jgi:Ca2+-binding EF-hand superfamily protein
MGHRSALQVGTSLAWLFGATLNLPPATAAEPSSAVIAKDDHDSDQSLDWREVQSAASARFAKLDQDGDSTVSGTEAQGIIGPAAFQKADTDHDGSVSKTEYLDLVKKLFQQADADHDGTLSAKELSSTAGRQLKPLIA